MTSRSARGDTQINKNEWEGAEKTAHQMLESLANICEAERHEKV